MIGMSTGGISLEVMRWEAALATTPYAGSWCSIYQKRLGWLSTIPNMDTLVALGTLVAYFYSLVALFTVLIC